MTNILGEYTLGEASAKLGVSPAWIGKVRRLTGVGGSLGVQGRKATFTDKDLEELATAKVLRALGIDYKDIKYIYGLEKDLLRLNESVKRERFTGKEVSLLLHSKSTLNLLDKKVGAKGKQPFLKKLNDYKTIMDKVRTKSSMLIKQLMETNRKLDKMKLHTKRLQLLAR